MQWSGSSITYCYTIRTMRFSDRPLAITNIETTGLDAQLHEIVELAILVVDPRTLKLRDRYTAKVRPENIRRANKRALAVCGYSDREWRSAISLEAAMEIYSQKTAGAVFVSHNVFFDYSFIDAAFKRTGVEDLTDYHRLDLFSLAWAKAPALRLESFTLDSICRALDIPPEPLPHRAIMGARTQLAVLKRLRT